MKIIKRGGTQGRRGEEDGEMEAGVTVSAGISVFLEPVQWRGGVGV